MALEPSVVTVTGPDRSALLTDLTLRFGHIELVSEREIVLPGGGRGHELTVRHRPFTSELGGVVPPAPDPQPVRPPEPPAAAAQSPLAPVETLPPEPAPEPAAPPEPPAAAAPAPAPPAAPAPAPPAPAGPDHQQLLAEAQRALAEAREQAEAVLAEAREQAQQALDQGRADAEQLRRDARDEADRAAANAEELQAVAVAAARAEADGQIAAIREEAERARLEYAAGEEQRIQQAVAARVRELDNDADGKRVAAEHEGRRIVQAAQEEAVRVKQ